MRDWSEAIAGLSEGAFELVCSEMEAEMSACITSGCFACPEPVLTVIARPR